MCILIPTYDRDTAFFGHSSFHPSPMSSIAWQEMTCFNFNCHVPCLFHTSLDVPMNCSIFWLGTLFFYSCVLVRTILHTSHHKHQIKVLLSHNFQNANITVSFYLRRTHSTKNTNHETLSYFRYCASSTMQGRKG